MREDRTVTNHFQEKCMKCKNSCCSYFTVRLPRPRSMRDFDGLLWQLYHENVKVMKDCRGWFLLINNSCLHLEDNGKCSIYENRPIVCHEHSHEECEFDESIYDSPTIFFHNHQSLEKFCKKKFKTWDKRSQQI